MFDLRLKVCENNKSNYFLLLGKQSCKFKNERNKNKLHEELGALLESKEVFLKKYFVQNINGECILSKIINLGAYKKFFKHEFSFKQITNFSISYSTDDFLKVFLLIVAL